MTVALFAPCYIDQLYPQVAIAALHVLERLGVEVDVPSGAACCGQPPSNAGFATLGDHALRGFVDTYADYDRTIVLSGSCALHVRAHASHVGAAGAHVADRTVEFCSFLHDVIGVERVAALGAVFPRRVAVHTGCHGLRGLGLASPSELRIERYDKVRALLGGVSGLTLATLSRPDECCGFGGSFAVGEPAVSVKMGRDRLQDYESDSAEAVVSTDVSCLMHLQGLARRAGMALPMLHVAQVLAGETAQEQVPRFARDDT